MEAQSGATKKTEPEIPASTNACPSRLGARASSRRWWPHRSRKWRRKHRRNHSDKGKRAHRQARLARCSQASGAAAAISPSGLNKPKLPASNGLSPRQCAIRQLIVATRLPWLSSAWTRCDTEFGHRRHGLGDQPSSSGLLRRSFARSWSSQKPTPCRPSHIS